jgi:hypothetical protein
LPPTPRSSGLPSGAAERERYAARAKPSAPRPALNAPFTAMNNANPAVATPWHVWVVGVVALLWNAMGALDYTMTESRNASYMKDFTAEQLAYFYSFPKWVIATWAVSVWGGVVGSIALLLRRRWAVPVFAASLATMAITFAHNFALTDGLAVMGGAAALVVTAAIVAVGAALVVYSHWLVRKGVLR